LATRDLAQEGVNADAVTARLEEESNVKRQLAETPLSVRLKIVCFVFCGLPGLLVAAYQTVTYPGSLRAREAWSWVGYGWLARVGLFLVGYLANG
jgi:hypothetical protein